MKKFILFLVLLTISGCQVAPFMAPIVTGVVMWKDGEAHKYYNEAIDPMSRSTKMALKELNLPISKDELVKNGHHMVAGNKDRFKITILEVRPHITKISIRVNFMGDKPYADLIYKSVDSFTDTVDFDNGRPIKGKKLLRRNQPF